MSCNNKNGGGLMDKLFKKKPTATKFAKAVRELDHKKVLQLIKKGADVNAEYRGKKPLQLLADIEVDTYGLNFTRVMELLINNGSVINEVTYNKYKDMAESLKEFIKNSVYIDAADEDTEEEIHNDHDVDSLEAYEILIEVYKKELIRKNKAMKKAIKKSIKGKKGFELGIGDIIGKMVAGAAQKKKKRVKKNKGKKVKKGGKKNKKTAKQLRQKAGKK